MLKDEFSEEGLPVSGHGVHLVDGNAGTDGCEGVPGKIEVRHGIYHEGIIILQGPQVVSQLPAAFPQGAFPDARHHHADHVPVRHGGQVLIKPLSGALVGNVGLLDELADKFLAHRRVGDGFRDQVRQVHHLHALGPKALGKGVMLPLGLFQVGDIIKQKPLQVLRHQVFQLLPGPVQHHLSKPPDLRRIMDACIQIASRSFHCFLHRMRRFADFMRFFCFKRKKDTLPGVFSVYSINSNVLAIAVSVGS